MLPSQRMRRLGWLFFRLMWIPFGALMIAMIGMPEGSYAWLELPPLARVSIIVGGILAGGAVVLLVGSMLVGQVSNRAVLANGQPAEARILKVWDTGTTVNNSFLVRFLLEVRPPGGSIFQAEVEQLVSRLEVGQIQPGSTVRVKYDPQTRAVAFSD